MAFVVRFEGRIWAFLQELAIRPVMGAGLVCPSPGRVDLCVFSERVMCRPVQALRAELSAPRCVLSARLHQDGPGGDEDSGAGGQSFWTGT